MDHLEKAAAGIIVVALIALLVVGYLMMTDSGSSGPGDAGAVKEAGGAPEASGGSRAFFDKPTETPSGPSSTPTPTPAAAPEPTPTAVPEPALISWQGEEVYLHGVNVPWYNWGCDFGCGSSEGVSSNAVQDELRPAFAHLQEAGIHVARWWVFPGEPWQITTDDDGRPTGIDPAVYADFDAALQLAEEYDLYYVFTLFSSPTRMKAAWLAQPEALATALGELFSRYADNPRILTWQVFNEPEWAIWNGEVDKEPVQAVVQAVAKSVHDNSGAYVSVGSAHIGGLPMWTGLGLDYYTAHWYDGMKDTEACAFCIDYARVKAWHGLDAPLVIGEFFAGDSIDAEQRFEDWRAKGYAGALAWSLLPDRTQDKMSIDMAAAKAFAGSAPDVDPTP